MSVARQPPQHFPMGYESGEGDMIPTGYESERAAGFDHDAKHGDPDERSTTTNPGAAAGLSRGYERGGVHTRCGGALRRVADHLDPVKRPY